MKNARRTNQNQAPNPAQGRPRNANATREILKAAMEMGMESGFDALTVEGIAARAGVGKTTIYRRWPNVWSIVADAVLADVDRLAPLTQTGSACDALRASMRTAARYFGSSKGQMLAALIGRSQMDEPLRKALVEQWLLARRKVTREIVRQGIANGELRPGLDEDIVIDALYGPLYHHLLLPYRRDRVKLSDSYIDALINLVFKGVERR